VQLGQHVRLFAKRRLELLPVANVQQLVPEVQISKHGAEGSSPLVLILRPFLFKNMRKKLGWIDA
jgi:hypothetical protein